MPNDRSLLANIAGDAITDEFYGITDTRIQNIALRNIMREPLYSMDRKRRNAAIKWIVYDWENIPQKAEEKDDRLYEMCSEFTDYADDEVNDFAKKYKGVRIASWSKVLAFADSDRYPIFDSHVSMSLNFALDEIDHSRKFITPPALSSDLNNVFKDIRRKVNSHYKRKKLSYMGYIEYKELLLSLVRLQAVPTVLNAEIVL